MTGRAVEGADGRRWRIRRRWLPWAPRLGGGLGFSPGGAVNTWDAVTDFVQGPGTFLLAVLAAAVAGLVLSLLTPLVFLAAEVVLLVVAVPVLVVLRLVIGVPWIVVATTEGPPREQLVREARGWRASEQLLESLAVEIQMGTGAPRTAGWTSGYDGPAMG